MEEEERRTGTCVIYGCGGGIVVGMRVRGEVERKRQRTALPCNRKLILLIIRLLDIR